MSNPTIENLQREYDDAVARRNDHVGQMTDSYDPRVMDQFQALQRAVSDAKSRLEAAQSAANEAPAVASDATMCVVTVAQGAKMDRCVEVPVGTTVAALLDTLGISHSSDVSIRKRIGQGQTAEITNPSDSKLEEGNHEIFLMRKVVGG